MQLSIDKFGRVVLPKAIRDELGLVPGAALEVRRTETGIELEPVRDKPALVDKEGVLVHTGTAVGDLESALRSFREGRLTKFSTEVSGE